MNDEFDLLGQIGSENLDEQFHETDEDSVKTEDTPQETETNKEDEEFQFFPEEKEVENSDKEPEQDKPVITTNSFDAYLKELGITDPTKVLWDAEDGEGPKETNFHELPIEDQLAILKSNNIDKILDESEIETINYFRENDVTLEEYTKYVQRQAVDEYIKSQQAQITINDLSDEELFKLDLLEQNKYVSEDQRMSEEEIDAYWKTIQNTPVLDKQLKILRETYLESEKKLLEEQELQKSQALQQEYLTLENEIRGLSKNIETIEDITLEDTDKQIIEDLLLKRDVNGITGLAKALNDPQTLYTTAWFLTKGSEAFSMIKNYYTKKIHDVEKEAYEAGRNSMKPKVSNTPQNIDRQLKTNKKPTLVVGKTDF